MNSWNMGRIICLGTLLTLYPLLCTTLTPETTVSLTNDVSKLTALQPTTTRGPSSKAISQVTRLVNSLNRAATVSRYTRRKSRVPLACRRCGKKPCEYELSGSVLTIQCMCDPPCLHEGECDVKKGKCACPSGYSGVDCGIQHKAENCTKFCGNGGYCRQYELEGEHCSCAANYSGEFCEIFVANSTDRCNQECQKKGKVCDPLYHNDEVISFECLNSTECRVHPLCKNGYCSPNDTRNDCMCHGCWTGQFCDFHCCKQCRNGGRCVVNGKVEGCDCPVSPLHYIGEFCDDILIEATPKPKVIKILPPETYKYILAASGSALVILLILLTILPYIMWRKRVLWILKIVYKFQAPVEIGEKEFDAFVSYSSSQADGKPSSDEKFVLRQLQKTLEEDFGFRLCLHYRDFIPGVAIAENIVQAVEQSHRTILILSQRFVESEWCQMEYQKAQHEMVMRRHNIIPILLDDIANINITDKNLQNILKAVTYIVWPGNDADQKKINHFWKKVVYSMPKKNGRILQSYPSTSSADTELSDLDLPPE